ncbi:MAG: permease, partial [Candidatus Heimdallarchaeota archaeon]|nr:permease [Candidatus Heimdallarchaeota archaeon]
MSKGPLLAYLLADPELSLQSILVTRKYLGDKKNSVYVLLVAFLTTIAGVIFGLYLGEGIGLY